MANLDEYIDGHLKSAAPIVVEEEVSRVETAVVETFEATATFQSKLMLILLL